MTSCWSTAILSPQGSGPVYVAWASHARELAAWTWQRLVNRVDAWGGYNALTDRDRLVTAADGTQTKLGASTTRPSRNRRGRQLLALPTIELHYRARVAQHLVGLHSTSPENTSLWGAVDIDRHLDAEPGPETTMAAAVAWFERSAGLGFAPLLTDSNGRGGFHLRILFDRPLPTARVFGFLRWLVRDYESYGLTVAPETFPKQAAILPGRYGNWLRLPGRHHTRDHWSSVWDGQRWLVGDQAAAFMLALVGDAPELIPTEALLPVAWPSPRRIGPRVVDGHRRGDDLEARILAYLARLPTGLSEGQHRDDYAFGLAAWLSRDMALGDVEALRWLNEWDGRQRVPKGERRLQEILANAKRYGHRAVGNGLGRQGMPADRIEVEL